MPLTERALHQCVFVDTWTRIDCGCSSKADIGALEMFVYKLKSNRKLCKFKLFFHCYDITCQLKRKLDGKSIANFVPGT